MRILEETVSNVHELKLVDYIAAQVLAGGAHPDVPPAAVAAHAREIAEAYLGIVKKDRKWEELELELRQKRRECDLAQKECKRLQSVDANALALEEKWQFEEAAYIEQIENLTEEIEMKRRKLKKIRRWRDRLCRKG